MHGHAKMLEKPDSRYLTSVPEVDHFYRKSTNFKAQIIKPFLSRPEQSQNRRDILVSIRVI
jgi:hypothetical protein